MDKATKFQKFLEYKNAAESASSDRGKPNVTDSWLPLRYATKEGWVLGAWTWKKKRGHCRISLFVCEDHEMYVAGSALNWSLRCIFTQAFYQTGSMEIQFQGPPPGRQQTLESGFEPTVPEEIHEYARQIGVQLKKSDRILHEEGRQMYFALTGFDRELISSFENRGVDPLWPCVLVQRDIWTEFGIRFFFEYARSPDRIFKGQSSPLNRVSWKIDLLPMRLVLAAERLKTYLLRFCAENAEAAVELKWRNPTTLQLKIESPLEIEVLASERIGWPSGRAFTALLLPRTLSEYRAMNKEDLAASDSADFLCVTRDFRSFACGRPSLLRKTVTLYDTLDDIDKEIQLRISQTVTSRAELAERHE